TNGSDPKFPPGFTPQNSDKSENVKETDIPACHLSPATKKTTNDQLEESVNKSPEGSKQEHVDSMFGPAKSINGFSILERFQEFIQIGQPMGYGMNGCEKDYRRIITTFWGNMLFDFATGSACGRSGGILCVWDKMLFHKRRTYSTDHCLCVEGVINCWHGETIVMGDFNK
ncbi:hypothetical protein Tco_1169225, partial [Tanacetum coccineum]